MNGKKDKVIGFFSLYNEEILISNGQKKSFKFKGIKLYRSEATDIYPAIRLHKFAIDTTFQGQYFSNKGIKYSDYLLSQVFEKVKDVAEITGCLLIGLEATENSNSFYKEYGFKTIRKKQGNTLPYFIFKVADLLT
ncbi:hypothetical protein [Bacillus sp. V59.32b]|uniref:hypothetical protein n=1 Tax=Bacillus sp. V59.32b TaxID=1758642 RepID=UPI000E3EB66E|nr:hypothetical protein [Bacillus sp. V59.32b]RFU68559.1 hypothetical protein D0463_04625 [Bacillus sp. V59.32b]